jgi:uncharacterized phiE125 gp8 family phage protein
MFGGIGANFYGAYNGYGTLQRFSNIDLTVQSPPQSFVEPVTLEEVKSYLRLPDRSPTDPDEDAELLSLISAARFQAEILQGRDLVRKQWDMTLDFWVDYFIRLRPLLVSVDLVQLRDSTGVLAVLAENTDYIVDTAKQPGVLAPPYNSVWRVFTPWPTSAILIRFTSGMDPDSAWWSAEGHLVRSGMKALISDWFNNRLPFALGLDPTKEYPYSVSAKLLQGAVRLVG